MMNAPLQTVDEEVAVQHWGDWTRAEDKLVNQCDGCQGSAMYDLNDLPLLHCARPELDPETFGVYWNQECPVQLAYRERVRFERLLGKAKLPRRFQDRRLKSFRVYDSQTRSALARAREFVARFGEREQPGLLLMGPKGGGKTHLAAGAVLDLLDQQVAARFYTAPDLLNDIYAAIPDNRVMDVVRGLAELPCLVIDDLGKEFIKQRQAGGYESAAWAMEQLFTLINRRYEDDRPVIITTNLTDAELQCT